MKSFVINGKEYNAKEFDFNTVCDLEDMGVNLEEADKKPMSMVRAYFAVCAGRNKEFAGKEIESHIIAGGSMEDVVSAMSYQMEESDFFRNIQKREEKKNTENKTEAEE